MSIYWLLIENVIYRQIKIFYILKKRTREIFQEIFSMYEIQLFLFLFFLLLPNIFKKCDENLKIKECWPKGEKKEHILEVKQKFEKKKLIM